MNLPFVNIITVNYNGKKYLKNCFSSLYKLNYPKNKLEMIMVDNCSIDDSCDFVKRNFPKVKIIKNDLNNYCRANNLAIKSSKAKFIALINNDLKVDKNWLIELIKVINRDRSIGAVTSKVLFPNGKLQSTGHYEFPNFYWSDRGFKEFNKGQYNEIEEVQSISHCATLYRKKCLDEAGLLDEDFNMYMEDVDMSIRLRQKRWRLFYAPSSIAYHKFHGSIDESTVSFYCERNRLMLIAKHYPRKLSEALLGKGYFTVLNSKNELTKILPGIFTKLFKYHDTKLIISILPGIFENLSKILSLEKDHLIKHLDLEKNEADLLRRAISQKDDFISQKDQQIYQKDQLLQQKDTEVFQLKEEINQGRSSISQRDQQLSQKEQFLQQKDIELSRLKEETNQVRNLISQKDQQIYQKDQLLQQKDTEVFQLKEEINQGRSSISQRDQQLSQKEQFLQQKDIEVSSLKERIKQIYDSETYRFIAQPIWKVLNILKYLKPKSKNIAQTNLLIIKPYHVDIEETEKALSYFREYNSKARIFLITNLAEEDYIRLFNNRNVDENIFYSPKHSPLTKTALLKLYFRLRKTKFEEAIVLIGNPIYHGYRKAKLLAVFSGAKRIKLYFIGTRNTTSLLPFTSFRVIWRSIYSNLLLFTILIIFSAFVIIPLKLRKFFRR